RSSSPARGAGDALRPWRDRPSCPRPDQRGSPSRGGASERAGVEDHERGREVPAAHGAPFAHEHGRGLAACFDAELIDGADLIAVLPLVEDSVPAHVCRGVRDDLSERAPARGGLQRSLEGEVLGHQELAAAYAAGDHAHSHEFLVLAYFEQGGGSICLGDREWLLHTGDAFVVAPGEVVRFGQHEPDTSTPGWCVFFPAEIIASQ